MFLRGLLVLGIALISIGDLSARESPDAAKIANWPAPLLWDSPRKPTREADVGDAGAAPHSAMAVPTDRLPFVGIAPCRIVDTRGNGFTGGYGPPPLIAGVPRNFVLTGQCGILPTAEAVSLNVTVVNPLGPGHIVIYPQGGAQPDVSTLNYVAGQTIANAAIVPLGDGGGITVVAGVSGTDLLIDTNGFYGLDRITRSVSIPLTSFFDCQTSPHALLDFTDGVDAIASLSSFAVDGFGTLLSFDAVAGSPDEDSEVCSQLMVPADYVAGGVFRINADKNDHLGAQELLNCAVSVNSGPLQAVGTIEIDSSSPEQYVCSPSFGLSPGPGRSLAFYLSITSPGVMDDFVTISSVAFEYSSAK